MTEIDVTWQAFKIAVQSNTNIQVYYTLIEGVYNLRAFDGVSQLICSLPNDGRTDTVDFETTLKAKCNRSIAIKTLPFADKILPNGKKIYTRIHGIQAEVQNSMDTIEFVVPYTSCKITGIEIFGAKLGDIANFKVVDTASGTYSGAPNYVLNQFGFSINLSKDTYKYISDYDADLYINMRLRIEYDALDEVLPRPIYINFILHEIKD